MPSSRRVGASIRSPRARPSAGGVTRVRSELAWTTPTSPSPSRLAAVDAQSRRPRACALERDRPPRADRRAGGDQPGVRPSSVVRNQRSCWCSIIGARQRGRGRFFASAGVERAAADHELALARARSRRSCATNMLSRRERRAVEPHVRTASRALEAEHRRSPACAATVRAPPPVLGVERAPRVPASTRPRRAARRPPCPAAARRSSACQLGPLRIRRRRGPPGAARRRDAAPRRAPPVITSRGQLVDRARDRRDALEHAALEHVIGELDVELALEREHHVDARVRGHARLVEVGVVGERRRRPCRGGRAPCRILRIFDSFIGRHPSRSPPRSRNRLRGSSTRELARAGRRRARRRAARARRAARRARAPRDRASSRRRDPSALIAASLAAKRAASRSPGAAPRAYAISPSVKTRRRKRSPNARATRRCGSSATRSMPTRSMRGSHCAIGARRKTGNRQQATGKLGRQANR